MSFTLTALLNPAIYDHPVTIERIEVIETHSSWVILTGDFAYKIKKPVNFGFLDFSTLEKRYACCQQELRLNRRLAAELYLDVIAITGTAENPILSGSGEAFEYAVKMVQFPQAAQLDEMLQAGKLHKQHITAFADKIADFHTNTPPADQSTSYGSTEAIYQPISENFDLIQQHLSVNHGHYEARLAHLKKWNQHTFNTLIPQLEQRKKQGFIRECHGDMHLRNLVWLDNKPMAFDCIEFNAELRWVDVISDLAFLIMDLQNQQQHQLATLLLNRYLEQTGDYAGLAVLPFYLCYRAMVKAKVSALRLVQQHNSEEQAQTSAELSSYLALANRYTKTSTPTLIIMCGLSASGKSTVSEQLLLALNAIRIRSDRERKRLFDIPVAEHKNKDIYSTQASEQTYNKLATLATQVIQSGYSVIVDAAFLRYEQRHQFHTLANGLAVPFVLLQVTASKDVLRQRIVARKNDISDANLAVLEQQFLTWQPFRKEEMATLVSVNTEHKLDTSQLMDDIKRPL